MEALSQYDLAVIGGGPAGASAAITAARGGHRVLLLERSRLPRHKVCGEFVSSESLGLLRSLLGPAARSVLDPALRIPRARLFLDGGVLEAPVEPPAASLARFQLDAALWTAAEDSGARCRQQVIVEDIIGRGPFRLHTSAGLFDARAVIDASGRGSNLKQRGVRPRPVQNWLGIKAHFQPSHARGGEDAAPSVDLYFFARGYCGVQPLGEGLVNVCAMVRCDRPLTFDQIFALEPRLLARSLDWKPAMRPVHTFPLSFRSPQVARLRVVHAGDAAGFVDPFVGDGIAIALRSGALAGQALSAYLGGELTLDAAIARYRRDYQRQIQPVFENASRLRRLTRLPAALRKPIVRVLQVPALATLLVRKTRSRTAPEE